MLLPYGAAADLFDIRAEAAAVLVDPGVSASRMLARMGPRAGPKVMREILHMAGYENKEVREGVGSTASWSVSIEHSPSAC